MTGIELYSTTAANNNSATPNGWPEGQAPSTVNDCARQMQAAIRAWYESAEWINWGDTTVYVGATQFKISGSDVTSRYSVGRRIKAVGTATGTIYGTISVSSFSTDTTLTVVWDSGSLSNEALTISIASIKGGASAESINWNALAGFSTAAAARATLGVAASGANTDITSLAGTSTNDSAAAGKIGEFISSQAATGSATVTITIASPAVITWSGHNFTIDSAHNFTAPIVFTTTGALPTGITASTVYWIIGSSVTSNTFQIATSIANALAGTSINTSGTQSGTHTGTAGITLTTATASNVAALSLPAGDWDLRATTGFNSTGSSTQFIGAINTTSATFPTAPGNGAYAVYTASTGASSPNYIFPIGFVRISIASTTTVYLVAQATFSTGADTAFGFIGARRVR